MVVGYQSAVATVPVAAKRALGRALQPARPLQKRGRYQRYLSVLLVDENDPDFPQRHIPPGGFVAHAELQVEAVFIEVGRVHFHPHGFAVKSFGLVLGHDVAHHDEMPLHVELKISQPGEEAHPRLRDQCQQLCIVKMPALVDVANVDLHFRGKGVALCGF